MLQITYSHAFTIQPKIINGSLSNPQLFPFFVRLDSDAGTCGGSLLNDKYFILHSFYCNNIELIWKNSCFRWILTAAHCLVEAQNLNILIGFNAEGDYQSSMKPQNLYIHPDYIEDSVANDIG